MSAADQHTAARQLSLCASLRTRLAEAVAAKSSAAADGGASASAVLAEGSLTLIDLKAVNRGVWELVNSYKERTQRANAGVDAAELKLQNLQYEKNHFLREITHLRDFRPDAGPKITLIDEAAFAREAPPELLSVTKSEDPHQFHLNRLQLELRQRKALCETRDKGLAERAAAAERNAEKQGFLDGLQAQLSSLVTLSHPLQKLLDQRSSQRWAERRKLPLLAPPLQALYVRAVAYRDTAAPQLELFIVGDIAAAEEMAAQRLHGGSRGGKPNSLFSPRQKRQRVTRGSGGGKGDEAGGGDGRGGGGGGDAADKEEADEDDDDDDALRAHPLHVRVSFRAGRIKGGEPAGDAEEGEADDGEIETASAAAEIRLQFCCLPASGLIAARVLGAPPALLVNLFDDDAGAELPLGAAEPGSGLEPAARPAGAPLAAKEVLAALLPSAPFKWAQQLGAPLPSGAVSPLALPALRRFGQVIDAIAARVAARETLAAELGRLSTHATAPPPPAAIHMPPAPLVTKLTSWREIEMESGAAELSQAEASGMGTVPGWQRVSQRAFAATLERAQPAAAAPVQLSMLVQVFAEYPRAAPRVTLWWDSPPARVAAAARRELPEAVASLAAPAALRLARRHAAGAADAQLIQMQAELNAPLAEVAAEGAPYHLLWTVHRARMLLDVYLETEPAGGGRSAAVCGTLCNRRVRGRDRRKPLHFSRTTGQFDQAN